MSGFCVGWDVSGRETVKSCPHVGNVGHDDPVRRVHGRLEPRRDWGRKPTTVLVTSTLLLPFRWGHRGSGRGVYDRDVSVSSPVPSLSPLADEGKGEVGLNEIVPETPLPSHRGGSYGTRLL